MSYEVAYTRDRFPRKTLRVSEKFEGNMKDSNGTPPVFFVLTGDLTPIPQTYMRGKCMLTLTCLFANRPVAVFDFHFDQG